MMKKTNEACFKNAVAFLAWQEHNCLNCKKAVFYNDRLHRMPKYRCAVQEQIEMQQEEVEEVSQRTFDAAQQSCCPFFVSKEEEKPKEEILDFSRGQSIAGVQIHVDAKKTSENVQKTANNVQKTTESVQQTAENVQKPAETLRKPCGNLAETDAILEKVARETGATIDQVKAAERRVLDKMFNEQIIPNLGNISLPTITEQQFKEKMKHESRTMLETFSFDENMMIAFVPLVISELAWRYARRALDYCAEHRISEVKKLGRAVKEVQNRYFDELKRDLDNNHLTRIANQTGEFFDECQRDFTILWFDCRQYLLKNAPEMNYMDMRTDAYCCVVMIDLLNAHNRRMDALIAKKMGQCAAIDNPQMKALATLMDAYFPDGLTLKPMDTEIQVFLNKIAKVEFGIEEKAG